MELTKEAKDSSPYRLDEPYRQALRGMHARLAATAQNLIDRVPGNPPIGERPPYESPAELLTDLDVIEAALHQHGAQAVANGRLTALRGAVETFGFHLATVDLRQNSAVHEQVVDEMLRIGGVSADYLALDEAHRVEVLSAELATARPLLGVDSVVSELAESELTILRTAAGILRHLRAQRHRELHHLQVRVGVRRARGGSPVPRGRAACAPPRRCRADGAR